VIKRVHSSLLQYISEHDVANRQKYYAVRSANGRSRSNASVNVNSATLRELATPIFLRLLELL